MVEVIGIHVDLASDEIGKSHLDDRALALCVRFRDIYSFQHF